MKLFAAVIAVAVFGAGLCRADEQAATPPSGDSDTPTRPLKAVLYEVSREHTIQRRFAGSVVWHTDQVVSTDEPLPKLVIGADVEIPDLQAMVKLVVARNDDRSFRASHTVEITVTLPPDFTHGRVINIPRILMKEGETTPGIPLNSVAVMITRGLFQIGLSNFDTDRQRNIELIKERSWIDLPIIYSDGSWAILGIEKAPLGGRALAVLESPDVEPPAASSPQASASIIPRVPADHLPGAVLKPWPVAATVAPLNAALSAARLNEAVRPKPSIAVQARPLWSWPPLSVWWSWMPWSLVERWTWQLWSGTELPGTVRLASLAVPAPVPQPPPWLQTMSVVTLTTAATPSWPRVRPPDFRIPAGPGRFEGQKNLIPPSQFVRWSDRIETVLPLSEWREVDRRCRAILGKSPPSGIVWRGCTRGVAGRCLITRVDDPGVARHELAHCNGGKHPY